MKNSLTTSDIRDLTNEGTDRIRRGQSRRSTSFSMRRRSARSSRRGSTVAWTTLALTWMRNGRRRMSLISASTRSPRGEQKKHKKVLAFNSNLCYSYIMRNSISIHLDPHHMTYMQNPPSCGGNWDHVRGGHLRVHVALCLSWPVP